MLLHLYMKYSEYVIVYAVIVHQTNISYTIEGLSGKHLYNHMIGQAASVVSPFYFILLGSVLLAET